jgi:hypothetical protein
VESVRRGEERPGIRWAEDVVDNEGLGRKKSKGMFELYSRQVEERQRESGRGWIIGLLDLY